MFKTKLDLPCQCINRSYKFILMDLQMPEMDGFKASEQILELTKQQGVVDYCHIVALTSFSSYELRDRVLKIGLKDLICKPLRKKDLQKMVYLHFYRKSEDELKK